MVWDANLQQLSVSLQVSGLAPGRHPTHLHLGTCKAPGALLYPLPDLQANDFGQATMKPVIIKNVAHLPQEFLINVHNGPTMAETQQQNIAIACGMISRKDARAPLKAHVILQGTTAANESASGTAQVAWDVTTGILSAAVKVHGLQLGSRHAVHIHAGRCEQQGKMLYPLPVLVADKHGDASSSATFHVTSLPAEHVYLNVHYGEQITDAQGKIIIPAFNPILCGNFF
ncbi:hypothetical protein KSF_109540 [Reticulibacter mediterranei]|uniref:CHRD domain-containing protein n=1 Tax=Reticulibacter mediterranei TaxID=2778369 RepID=A0A8J3J3J5_9CHLR|nr:hypothetical protein KSF_109540 [Reticulibacter mediterranei]